MENRPLSFVDSNAASSAAETSRIAAPNTARSCMSRPYRPTPSFRPSRSWAERRAELGCAQMRILFWHGYLLGGTARTSTPAPSRASGAARGTRSRSSARSAIRSATTSAAAPLVVPELPQRLLPVFVLDRYEGLEARLLQDFTPAERERYVAANAAALSALKPADLVFANHVLLGGPVAAASGARFAVKAHGSSSSTRCAAGAELERWGAEALARADAVFVGSAHIRAVLEDVVGHVERVHEVPPGVDVEEFRPEPRGEGARRPARRGASRSAQPGQRRRAATRTRATPSVSPPSSRARSRPSSTSAS